MTNEKKLELNFKDTCELYLEEAGIKEEWQRLRISGKLWVLIAKNLGEKKFSKQEILDLFPEENLKGAEGKISCDCSCNGPFCNELLHPCIKPDEHYSQKDKAIVEIRKEYRQAVIDALEKNT